MFVRRLLSRAIAEEEWVPPGLGYYDRMRWERLTDEQKRLVKRVYEFFKEYAGRLEHRALSYDWLAADSNTLSWLIGVKCNIYSGFVSRSRDIDKIEKKYNVNGAEARTDISVYHETTEIGLRCYIGKDRDGRDTYAYAEVPVELVRYVFNVYGDPSHTPSSILQEAFWIARVGRKEPVMAFLSKPP